jgi:hypothetical protein
MDTNPSDNHVRASLATAAYNIAQSMLITLANHKCECETVQRHPLVYDGHLMRSISLVAYSRRFAVSYPPHLLTLQHHDSLRFEPLRGGFLQLTIASPCLSLPRLAVVAVLQYCNDLCHLQLPFPATFHSAIMTALSELLRSSYTARPATWVEVSPLYGLTTTC